MNTLYSTNVNYFDNSLFLVCSGVVGTLGLDDFKGNKPNCPLGQASVPSFFWVQPHAPA